MLKTLILFAKKPELGKVKTRLAKSIGNKEALSVYTRLLENTITVSTQVDATTKIYWSEKPDTVLDKCQVGNDLGERMYNSLSKEVEAGKVCLIGTDIPSISHAIIEEAFEALNNCDVVFGPAKDGGYYLVGIKEAPQKELFLQKQWSHKFVLKQALDTCSKLNLSVKLLPTLQDIDTINDYNDWQTRNNISDL